MSSTPSESHAAAPVEVAPAAGASVRAASRSVHAWFGVITLIYALDFADRFLVSAILPQLKEEFGLSDAHAGMLGGVVYLGLSLFALPSGVLVDRWSRTKMVALMTALWSLATGASGLVRSFPALLGLRVLVGAGEAGYNPAGYALIAAWYPERLRGLMVGLFNVAQPVGAGFGIAFAGYIAQHYGWRHVFGILALPGLVLALVVLFAPDFRTRPAEGTAGEAARFVDALRFIRGNRTLLWIFAAQLPVGFYAVSWSVWAPSFFTRVFAVDVSVAAKAMMVSVSVAGLGPPIGGWLSDRWVAQRPAGRLEAALTFLAVLLVLHLALFAGAGRALGFTGALVLAAVAQFFMAAHWGTLVSASLDLTPPQYRGTCQAFLPLAQGLVAFGSAALTGALSDHWGLAIALAASANLGIGLALLLIAAARRSYNTDHAQRLALGSFEVELDG
jgi:MFS family permease